MHYIQTSTSTLPSVLQSLVDGGTTQADEFDKDCRAVLFIVVVMWLEQ